LRAGERVRSQAMTRWAVRVTRWWTDGEDQLTTWSTREQAEAFCEQSKRDWPDEYYEVVPAPEKAKQ
jgi:hypothetical protein